MSNPTNYTVGWICAINPEYVAAQEFLDEEHDPPELLQPNDSNEYTLGRIGSHYVVIAVLPDGEYGTASAASVATGMLSSFPNIRIGMMVGIGGGAPSARNDIRLGDIVVSAPRDGGSGVFQYDFGKTIQNRKFQHTRFLNQPPTVLQTALAGIQAQYKRKGHRLEQAINSIIEKNPRLRREYQRPAPETDLLFKPEVEHKSSGCAKACALDALNLVARRERTEYDDNPTIHYGRIASANQLMKNAMIRDKLAEDKNVLCFEMEAAGLMNHFPCLIIRGICDYSDSHKNKEWQGYAALAAAAYAKDLLSRILPGKVENEKRISEILSVAIEEITSTNQKVQTVKMQLEKTEDLKILNWITSIDYGPQHSDILRRWEPNTLTWFLDSEEYKTWSTGSKRIMYCPGIPGSGKTIITSVVINDLIGKLQNDPDSAVAYIYFNFQRNIEQTAEDSIASLLKQFTQKQSTLPDVVRELYNRHQRERTKPLLSEYITTLHLVASEYSRVYIVVDALDECRVTDGCRSRFISELADLQKKLGANIFATSRFSPDINERFDDIRLEIRATENDVRRYLDSKIPDLSSFVGRDVDLQEDIRATISNSVDGMFLLAQFHMQTLADMTTPKKFRMALKNLAAGSDGYDSAYEVAMQRIESQVKGREQLAKKVLLWITCAKRQLKTSELREALAVEDGESRIDHTNMAEIEDLVSVCAGLVTIDTESDIIRLVHYSTQEYFERTRWKWFPTAHEDILKTCLTYLLFDEFRHGECNMTKDFKLRLQSHQLYRYVASNWGHHARLCDIDIETGGVLGFLSKSSHLRSSVEAIFIKDEDLDRDLSYEDYLATFPRDWSGFHLAAFFGLDKATKWLLSCEMRGRYGSKSTTCEGPDAKDTYGKTPLALAAENGHEGVVNLLLDRKVDIDCLDHFNRSPLSWAAEHGQERVVRLLINRGTNALNLKDRIRRTPLCWASRGGHDQVVNVLLNSEGIDIDAKDISSRTPLSWAAEMGHSSVVKLLLNTGKVDINTKDYTDRTPWLWAMNNNHGGVSRLLLSTRKVDVNSSNEFGETMLSKSAANGDVDTVKMLLVADNIDINHKNKKEQTPLQLATLNDHEKIVELLLGTNSASEDDWLEPNIPWFTECRNEKIIQMLLNAGYADINSRATSYGGTILHWTSMTGNEPITRVLLADEKIDVNLTDDLGRTPLHVVAENGHGSIARMLIDSKKAEIDLREPHSGHTPFYIATLNESVAVMKILLESGMADVNSKTKSGVTPFLCAAMRGNETALNMLLGTGKVDLQYTDPFLGLTALSVAVTYGHEAIVRKLLRLGDYDLNRNDAHHGLTPILLAAWNGHEEIVKLFLDIKGINVEIRDTHLGRTALLGAAAYGHGNVVKLLLDHGDACIETKDSMYAQNPLFWAAKGGHLNVVKILLDHGELRVDEEDNSGFTALQRAWHEGHNEIVEMLIAHGASESDDFYGLIGLFSLIEGESI